MCCFAGIKKAPQNNLADAGDDKSSVVNHLDKWVLMHSNIWKLSSYEAEWNSV